MKRRKLLVTAIATWSALALAAATTSAAETGLAKSVSTSTTRTASATTSQAKTVTADYFAEDGATEACATCDPCQTCCDPCGTCGPSPWFLEAEGLLWWRKSRPLPPLLTTSLPGTLQGDAGVIGAVPTRTLFGGDNYGEGPQPGARISFGRWLDDSQCTGVAANFYFLGQESIDTSLVAAGPTDILAIPFNNVSLPGEDALLLNFPGLTSSGRASVQYQNDVLGGDAYVRRLLYVEDSLRIDAIGGYQFARVDDGLLLSANYVEDASGANLDLQDSFLAKNEFHGGSLGLLARVDNGLWTVKAIAKCAVGNMHQSVDIAGRTVVTPNAGPVTTTAGGLFTQPTNIGSTSNNEFAFIPEAKLNIGYRMTENWTLGVGYSFIYFSDVMTAGRAIDRNLNLTQVPGPIVGPAVPAPPSYANTSDFWVQGLNFSAEFAY